MQGKRLNLNFELSYSLSFMSSLRSHFLWVALYFHFSDLFWFQYMRITGLTAKETSDRQTIWNFQNLRKKSIKEQQFKFLKIVFL